MGVFEDKRSVNIIGYGAVMAKKKKKKHWMCFFCLWSGTYYFITSTY